MPDDTRPTNVTTVTVVASVIAGAGKCSLTTNTTNSFSVAIPAGAALTVAIPVYRADTGTGGDLHTCNACFHITIYGNKLLKTHNSMRIPIWHAVLDRSVCPNRYVPSWRQR